MCLSSCYSRGTPQTCPVIQVLISKRLSLWSSNPEWNHPEAGVHCCAGWWFGLCLELVDSDVHYLTPGRNPGDTASRIFKIQLVRIQGILTKSSQADHKTECTVGRIWGILAAKQLNPSLKSPVSHYLHDSRLTDGLMPILRGNQFFNWSH